MKSRFPGYDVLAKRDTPSWNDITRRVVDERLAILGDDHRFLGDEEFRTLRAVCDRVLPQAPDAPRLIPVAALIDRKLHDDQRDGYRDARLPPLRDAWRRGLAALQAEARAAHGRGFDELEGAAQDALLERVQKGDAHEAAWAGMPPDVFFSRRLMRDAVAMYYAHPAAWNEIGFGGPASPRGYVRMGFDERDKWEASEAGPGDEIRARKENARAR